MSDYTPHACPHCRAAIGGWDQDHADEKFAQHLTQHHA